jgi:hypothetical protein
MILHYVRGITPSQNESTIVKIEADAEAAHVAGLSLFPQDSESFLRDFAVFSKQEFRICLPPL